MDTIDHFFDTARERYSILLARRQGLPPEQWTEDPIFQQYRFCNVFREDDVVTAWFREHVREPMREDARVAFAATCFRFFNIVSTGQILLDEGLLQTWDPDKARVFLKDQRPLITGAYMVKTPLRKPKLEGLIEILTPVYEQNMDIVHTARATGSLQAVHERLTQFPWIGPFMAYQVVSDLRYTYLLEDADDINTWASLGPGSARGVSRVFFGRPDKFKAGNPRHEHEAVYLMQELLEDSRDPEHWPAVWPEWEMANIQHWLCEFDKYERTRLGEGTPKQKYNPRKED